MDFERLEPRKQSSRVGAVRILLERPVRENVAENDLNKSPNAFQHGATAPPWALLWPTCDLLRVLGGGRFLVIFDRRKTAKKFNR